MGLPFCWAMDLRVSTALAQRPDSMSKRGLSGSHCGTPRGLAQRRFYLGDVDQSDVRTLMEIRNIPIGTTDSPSSHLQPRVGIMISANTISNMAPKDQKSWSTQTHHAGDDGWPLQFNKSISSFFWNSTSVALPAAAPGSGPLLS